MIKAAPRDDRHAANAAERAALSGAFENGVSGEQFNAVPIDGAFVRDS
jgi:hypothetical protein